MSEMKSDWELLVQRFLDQDLSAEERVRFVVQLGRDEGLRQRVIELEQLVLNVGKLPKPAVPDGFVAGVMERTSPTRPVWQRLAAVLWTPRAFQWNLATAVGGACLALLVTGGVVYGTLSWQRTSAPGGAGAPPLAVASPSTVLVRLVVVQRDARTVQVAGDFNGWNPARTPLEEVSSGAWAVTIPLEPGRYEYMYVIDGQHWIADPFAAEQNDDGFGSRNAVLDVRPPMETPGAPL